MYTVYMYANKPNSESSRHIFFAQFFPRVTREVSIFFIKLISTFRIYISKQLLRNPGEFVACLQLASAHKHSDLTTYKGQFPNFFPSFFPRVSRILWFFPNYFFFPGMFLFFCSWTCFLFFFKSGCRFLPLETLFTGAAAAGLPLAGAEGQRHQLQRLPGGWPGLHWGGCDDVMGALRMKVSDAALGNWSMLTYTDTHRYTRIYIYIYTHIYIYRYTGTYIHMYDIYTHIHITHTHIYIYIHIYHIYLHRYTYLFILYSSNWCRPWELMPICALVWFRARDTSSTFFADGKNCFSLTFVRVSKPMERSISVALPPVHTIYIYVWIDR